MGMYDNVRSSYKPLGKDFLGQNRTKDIEECGIGGTMSQYWISPKGKLYLIDYSGTADLVEVGDKFLNFRWVPNGTRGKVTPCAITNYVVIYPEGWEGDWISMPRCRIHFRDGIVQDHVILETGELT
jgi:hypothetical protein